MKNLHVHVWVCSTWDISGFFHLAYISHVTCYFGFPHAI